MWFYHGMMCPKDAYEIANTVDPNQTAPGKGMPLILFAVSLHKKTFVTV